MVKEILRKAEVEEIAEWIIEKQQILLIGERGSGKTVLLQALLERMLGRRTTLMLDLAFVTDWPEFMQRFKDNLQQLGKENGTLFLHLKRFLETNPFPVVEQAENCIGWLEQFSKSIELTGLDVLFVLEDLDQETFLQDDLDAFCKALWSGRTCQLLVSTTRYTQLEGFVHYALAPLQELHFKTGLTHREVTFLEYAKGNMQFYQELQLQAAGEDTVEEVAAHVLQPYQRHFLLLKNRFTPMQWNLLCAMALDEVVPQPHAFDFLVKHYLGAASSVERALGNLKQSGFVQKGQEGWQLTDVYLMRWLQQVYGKTGNVQ
jgi:energy-coupling factor transporter ATP-binding protein EcfA2